MSGTRTLFCHVTTATRAFAIYYLVSILMVAVDLTVALIRGKEPFSVSTTQNMTRGQHIFDVSSSFLMLFLMSVSCGFVLFARHKGPSSVIPFVLLLFVDVCLTVLSLADGPWGLPGTPTYTDTLRLTNLARHNVPLENADLCRFTMVFGVLFVFYVLFKVYMFEVALRSYYAMKEEDESVNQGSGISVTVKLPSYDEALQEKPKDTPPEYTEP
ncbi:mtp family protein [Chanos chanos]|uniref:Mtp family protein n=1 Tax=Chanos chanos TaxID=29144 RepID=A0A6J2WPK9_CHACN|nr:uncharacterized protein LOC115825702 [Chanos chanos]